MEWAKEVDAAIQKGLLDAKCRKQALALIRKDREAYDKLMAENPGVAGSASCATDKEPPEGGTTNTEEPLDGGTTNPDEKKED
jgi:hypothetical protein